MSYKRHYSKLEPYCTQPDMPLSITPDSFKELIKTLRCQYTPTPEQMVYSSFCSVIEHMFRTNPSLSLKQLALSQASTVVEQTRTTTWAQYHENEKNLCIALIQQLLPTTMLQQLTPEQTQSLIAECMQDYFYDLALSNTQSRRSRAGLEFESLLELLLYSAGIPVVLQGDIGKIGKKKSVDMVVPSTFHYLAEPTKTALISAKTTLRERWQEVIEEAQRIQCSQMYLATLDDKISPQTLNLLYDSKIYLVTTARNKAAFCNYYRMSQADVTQMLSFEEMLIEIKALAQNYNYQNWDDVSWAGLKQYYQTKAHTDQRPLVRAFYQQQLAALHQQRP